MTLLGGFAVQVDDQPAPVHWRLRKAKSVVKLLALAEGHRVHREVLMDALWPDLAAASAANNLHQALHAARRALAANGDSHDWLRVLDDMVVLGHAGRVETDLDAFHAAAGAALASHRIEDCRSALDGFPTELLPDDRLETWSQEPRDRVLGLRRQVESVLAEAMIDVGRAQDAVRVLQTSTGPDEAEESRLRLLMRALDACGRPWDAVEIYEALRGTLEAQYAATPQPATVALHRRILAGQAEPFHATGNLPLATSSFVGRQRELSALHALADRTRLLTLTGAGGVGKTRLALQLAHGLARTSGFPDGTWFVDLSGLRDGSLVAASAAVSLRLTPTAQVIEPRAVADLVGNRCLVVILDNCEHVLDASAALVDGLLATCPGVFVIATSREPLHLPGEVVSRVPSLQLPGSDVLDDPRAIARHESVQLFVRRGQQAVPAFGLDSTNARAVARICRRLDGIPLALEIAAAHVSHFAPEQLAGLLEGSLTTLTATTRGVPERQATLAATLDWSHSLLAPDESELLHRLSVFAGGFSLQAAAGICSGHPTLDVADVLIRLVDKSLVVVETAGVSDARYRLLEVVREYAARLLAASGEAEAFRNAHARWYVERAAGLDPEGGGGFVSEPDAWFVSELENLRIALASMLVDDPRRALAAIVAAWRAWLSRGLHAEGLRWLSRALAASPEPSDLRARALFGAAVFEIRLGRSARAGEIGRQIARIGPQLADQPRRLETLHQEALLSWLAGRWAETDRCVAELNGPLADCPGVLVAHEHLRAILALSRGDIRGARSAALASLAALDAVADDNRPFFSVCSLAFSVGHVRGLHFPVFEETMLAGRRVGAAQARPYVHSTLAWAERMAGQWQAAVAALDQAGRGFRAIDDPAGQAHVLVARGHLLREMGELETSRECFRAAVAKRREANDQRGTAIALTGLALCEANTGAVARARDLADEGARLLEGSGDLPGRSGALDNRAALEVVAGNLPGAAASVEEALSLAAVTPSHRSAGWQHTLLAGLRWRLGDPVGAAAEAQAARDVFSQIGEQRGLAAVRRVAFASSLQSHR